MRKGLLQTVIVLGLASVVAIICVTWSITKQRSINDLAVYKARLEQHCGFIRLQLADELASLFASSSREKQQLAQIGFANIEANDWREIALCAPEGARITHGCEPGDVPCMASATANAVLMIGAHVR